jgi:hypothetical protein
MIFLAINAARTPKSVGHESFPPALPRPDIRSQRHRSPQRCTCPCISSASAGFVIDLRIGAISGRDPLWMRSRSFGVGVRIRRYFAGLGGNHADGTRLIISTGSKRPRARLSPRPLPQLGAMLGETCRGSHAYAFNAAVAGVGRRTQHPPDGSLDIGSNSTTSVAGWLHSGPIQRSARTS